MDLSANQANSMNPSQVLVIAMLVPLAFVLLMIAIHKIPRVIPPYRQAIRDATDRVPQLTNRPVRRVDVVGRDNDRLFIHVSFADATTFGTDAGRRDRISNTPSSSEPCMQSQLPTFVHIGSDRPGAEHNAWVARTGSHS